MVSVIGRSRSNLRLMGTAAILSAIVLLCDASHAGGPRGAAAPETALVNPPPQAETWTITASGQRFGAARRWTAPDGTRWSRDTMEERGYRLDLEQQIRFTRDGGLRELTVRGSTSSGEARESFKRDATRYSFESSIDGGSGALDPSAFYVPFDGTLDASWALVEALWKAPGHSLALLPSGRATMEPLTRLKVSNGRETRELTLQLITGLDLSPQPVWLDGIRVFGLVGSMSFLPEGWESVASALSEAQIEAMADRATILFKRVAKRPSGPVAFTNVALYDADARTFRTHMTVVVDKGMIMSVGPAATISVPAGAQIIAGHGKTLIPGLWDSHKHYGDDATGVQLLSQGITSIRDLGTIPETMASLRKRIDANQLLGPRIVPLLMIDGPGPQTDHVAVVVKNEAEARAAAHRAKAEGYAGIKIYGSLDPSLITPAAEEAHKLGLRVQGHLPRTVRPLDAVRWGFDEITHINFVLMQAMPDAVVNETKGLEQRHYGPMRHAASVDFGSPAMTAWLDELARRGATVDPTLAAFEGLWATDKGQARKAFLPLEGTLPPQFERSLKQGGLAPLDDLPRPVMRAAFDKAKALVATLHRRGIPILAGSDGYGFELVRELELYIEAGLSHADALAAATIVPAKTLGLDRETGSIAAGKRAELVLVEGDPGKDIGALRRVELVMRAGFLMKVDDLRRAAGLSSEPR